MHGNIERNYHSVSFVDISFAGRRYYFRPYIHTCQMHPIASPTSNITLIDASD